MNTMNPNRRHYVLDEQEKKNLMDSVLAILQPSQGMARAITAKQMADRLGYRDGRKIRVAIGELVHRGHLIAATTTHAIPGYFFVTSQEEGIAYLAVLRSRAIKTFQRHKDFSQALEAKYGIAYQMPLPLVVVPGTAPVKNLSHRHFQSAKRKRR